MRSKSILWTLVGIIVVLAIALAVVVLASVTTPDKFIKFLNPIAPIVAAFIALVALGVTATSTFVGARRSKRQATVDAWISWSTSSSGPRAALTDLLGYRAIDGSQAQALLKHGAELKGKNGPLSDADKATVSRSMIEVLNGLERLAVGAKLGVYETKTLASLGGTIIRRSRERFACYIVARQDSSNLDLRQKRAYIALDELASEITQLHSDEDRLTHFRG